MNPITAHHRVLMSTAELISEFEATIGCSTTTVRLLSDIAGKGNDAIAGNPDLMVTYGCR